MTNGTVVFAGGGSGGHLFPGLAVADELVMRNPELNILFVGSRRSIECSILNESQFSSLSLDAAPSTLLRKNPVKFLWRYWRSISQAKITLRELQANVVVGLGGYASVPVVSAAASLGIPSALLEQNVVAGRANRWLSRRANLVCHAFEEAISSTPNARKCRVTGNPIRHIISTGCELPNRNRSDEIKDRKQRKDKNTLLVFGGSQGATAVNAAVLSAIPKISAAVEKWRIVHQTGPHGVESAKAIYGSLGIEHVVESFFNEPATLYQQADLIVSRAGATTLAEVACAGIPAILIPVPNSLRDHQLKNAQLHEQAGAATIVLQQPDSQSTVTALSSELRRMMGNVSERHRMGQAMRSLAKPNAVGEVVDAIFELVGWPTAQSNSENSQLISPPNFQRHNRTAAERLKTERRKT